MKWLVSVLTAALMLLTVRQMCSKTISAARRPIPQNG